MKTDLMQQIAEALIGLIKLAEKDHVAKLETYKREWVGLTDAEIAQGCKESCVTERAWQSAVWWAEAKLKEKNTWKQPLTK